MKKYKVLFCDLDGTLIDTLRGETYPKGIWDMQLKFDVLDAIKKLAPEYVFIVSNQGGIEKGFVDGNYFFFKLTYIRYCIKSYCNIENTFASYCPSNNKDNPCRKPNIEMLERYFRDFLCDGIHFKKEDTLMIGDESGKKWQSTDTDKKTAENFGIDYMDVIDFKHTYK